MPRFAVHYRPWRTAGLRSGTRLEPAFPPFRVQNPILCYDTKVPYADPEDQRRFARAHYEANKETYKARAVKHRRQQRKRISQFIRDAKDKPCADCDVRYPYYVMQFDHIADKQFNIGEFSKKSIALSRIRREVEKCEVVCANCHAERTHQRAQLLSASTEPVVAFDEDDPSTLF